MKFLLIIFISLFTYSLSSEIIWDSDFGYFGADDAHVEPSCAVFDDDTGQLLEFRRWKWS